MEECHLGLIGQFKQHTHHKENVCAVRRLEDYTYPRDYEVREHIPHTWVSSNDSFFNLILARGHTAPLF